jgi:hypothetical protein
MATVPVQAQQPDLEAAEPLLEPSGTIYGFIYVVCLPSSTIQELCTLLALPKPLN